MNEEGERGIKGGGEEKGDKMERDGVEDGEESSDEEDEGVDGKEQEDDDTPLPPPSPPARELVLP